MPGKSGAKGRGHGGRPGLDNSTRTGEPVPGGGLPDDPGDRPPPMDPGGPMNMDGTPEVRGRTESSPGHLKKDAGAQSARDFAPGRMGRDRSGTS